MFWAIVVSFHPYKKKAYLHSFSFLHQALCELICRMSRILIAIILAASLCSFNKPFNGVYAIPIFFICRHTSFSKFVTSIGLGKRPAAVCDVQRVQPIPGRDSAAMHAPVLKRELPLTSCYSVTSLEYHACSRPKTGLQPYFLVPLLASLFLGKTSFRSRSISFCPSITKARISPSWSLLTCTYFVRGIAWLS